MNKIGWCHKTINPVVGCENGCLYCYARQQAKRQKQNCRLCYDFTPHIHPERLEQLVQRGNTKERQRWFVGSMCDLWSPGVHAAWRKLIWQHIHEALWGGANTCYIVLTKFPERIVVPEIVDYHFPRDVVGSDEQQWPDNLWVGVSATEQYEASERMKVLLAAGCRQDRTVLSLEPLIEDVNVLVNEPAWALVGPMTGPGAKSAHPLAASTTISGLRLGGVPVWMKDSCAKAWPGVPLVQEWPNAMDYKPADCGQGE